MMCSSNNLSQCSKKLVEDNKKLHVSQKRRSLTFNRRTQVFLVQCLDEYTDVEIKKVWITSLEAKTSQEDFVKNVSSQRQGHKEDDVKSICFLGIEHFISQLTIDERQKLKLSTINAVLNQQDELWRTSKHSPDLDSEWNQIAIASSRTSRGSTSLAAYAASKLAAECAAENAREIQREDASKALSNS